MTKESGKLDVFVSAVVVLGENTLNLQSCLENLSLRMSADFTEHEIILFVTRSVRRLFRDSLTIINRIPMLRTIAVASPCSEEVGIGCGMENAIGDFVVNLDLYRMPPESIRVGSRFVWRVQIL